MEQREKNLDKYIEEKQKESSHVQELKQNNERIDILLQGLENGTPLTNHSRVELEEAKKDNDHKLDVFYKLFKVSGLKNINKDNNTRIDSSERKEGIKEQQQRQLETTQDLIKMLTDRGEIEVERLDPETIKIQFQKGGQNKKQSSILSIYNVNNDYQAFMCIEKLFDPKTIKKFPALLEVRDMILPTLSTDIIDRLIAEGNPLGNKALVPLEQRDYREVSYEEQDEQKKEEFEDLAKMVELLQESKGKIGVRIRHQGDPDEQLLMHYTKEGEYRKHYLTLTTNNLKYNDVAWNYIKDLATNSELHTKFPELKVIQDIPDRLVKEASEIDPIKEDQKTTQLKSMMNIIEILKHNTFGKLNVEVSNTDYGVYKTIKLDYTKDGEYKKHYAELSLQYINYYDVVSSIKEIFEVNNQININNPELYELQNILINRINIDVIKKMLDNGDFTDNIQLIKKHGLEIKPGSLEYMVDDLITHIHEIPVDIKDKLNIKDIDQLLSSVKEYLKGETGEVTNEIFEKIICKTKEKIIEEVNKHLQVKDLNQNIECERSLV